MSTENRASEVRKLIGALDAGIRRLENILDRNHGGHNPEVRLSADEFDGYVGLIIEKLDKAIDATCASYSKAREDDERYTEMMRERISAYEARLAAGGAAAAGGGNPIPAVINIVPEGSIPAIVKDGHVMLCATPSGDGWVCEATSANSARWRRE